MRALVIEDFEPLQAAIAEALRELGWTVDQASTAQQGLWQAKQQTHDVIVLDLMLPDMHGLDLLHQFRQAGGESAVLILSAKAEVEDRVRGLELGADDYLVKPFAIEELQARAKSLIRRHGPTRSPVIQIDDLSINTANRTVERAGVAIDLQPREYAILEHLAHRLGQVVTRNSIWDHVYGFHDDSKSNVVDVYIASLRRKLEANNAPRLIHTRRGHGYVLESPQP